MKEKVTLEVTHHDKLLGKPPSRVPVKHVTISFRVPVRHLTISPNENIYNDSCIFIILSQRHRTPPASSSIAQCGFIIHEFSYSKLY